VTTTVASRSAEVKAYDVAAERSLR